MFIKIGFVLAVVVLVLLSVQATSPAPPGSPTGLGALSQITLSQILAMHEKLRSTLPIDLAMIGCFLVFGVAVAFATKGADKPRWLTNLGLVVLVVVIAQAVIDVTEDLTLDSILRNPSELGAALVRKLFWPKVVLFVFGLSGGLVALTAAFLLGRKDRPAL